MSQKVKLTVTVLDADIKLSASLIGFFSEMGYSLQTENPCDAKLGELNFVYERKK